MNQMRNAPQNAVAILGAALILLSAAGGACAQTDPPPFNPVGTFSFTTFVDGLPISGTLAITEGEDGYEGQILTDVAPPMPVTSVAVDGQTFTIEAAGPAGSLVIEVTATGDDLAGTWRMGVQSGAITGRRSG